ncbi:AfsA-related hotdog domain-containing protein [Streptomyces sp. LaPpAH-108]|uniref:AfsA-related hotdog domain-containing protein n=1 Tax=Streptomyces sp. LaPpAH-108 TaxID=1155714 RepID=UPI0003644107|nr:AfsA-related hotdog domain-containing protein [Streptomyces sp. LaPpAH-108]
MRQNSSVRAVVGDRFKEFLGNAGTVPVTDLLDALRSGDLTAGQSIVVGQGLSADQLRELRERTGADVPLPVERGLTHKHEAKNVLIGPVQPTGPGLYTAPLLLDQRVEVLEDHLTGQHIPAVTLLEAARQTWTVVVEQFLLTSQGPTRFVIGSIRSAFHSFVFPLPATIEFRLAHQGDASPIGSSVDCVLIIRQDNRIAAEFETVIRVIPEAVAVKQESMAARQAVRAALSEAAVTASAVAR